jgi:hypothetical protein
MENKEPRVTRVSEISAPDDNGLPRMFVQVEFMVGAHGPFTERFTRQDFSNSPGVKQKLTERANEINALSY